MYCVWCTVQPRWVHAVLLRDIYAYYCYQLQRVASCHMPPSVCCTNPPGEWQDHVLSMTGSCNNIKVPQTSALEKNVHCACMYVSTQPYANHMCQLYSAHTHTQRTTTLSTLCGGQRPIDRPGFLELHELGRRVHKCAYIKWRDPQRTGCGCSVDCVRCSV